MTAIVITSTQDAYLKELAAGPLTSRDLALLWTVSVPSVANTIRRLRDKGLVRSTRVGGIRGNIHLHELTMPYLEMDIVVRPYCKPVSISDEEIQHVAKLRNSGLTGQELIEAHHNIYPERPMRSILNMVSTARERRLCR